MLDRTTGECLSKHGCVVLKATIDDRDILAELAELREQVKILREGLEEIKAYNYQVESSSAYQMVDIAQSTLDRVSEAETKEGK
jgi:hypothetical protein